LHDGSTGAFRCSAWSLEKVELQITATDQAKLEQNPWHAADVPGTVILNDTGRWVYPTTLTGVNYRGSCRLHELIMYNHPNRLWKIKFDNAKPYRRMQEWNFDRLDESFTGSMENESLRYKLALDLKSIQSLLYLLNKLPDNQFADSIYRHFDIKNYIKCLVVANFICHSDGFPLRGKNFWLYCNPRYNRWSFHPWDLHSTFITQVNTLNQMGPECTIINVAYLSRSRSCETTKDRPLYDRLLN
jgi:hypothetical protein